MEAPSHRPGHVGYTPQPVSGMLREARAVGQLASSAVRAAIELVRPTAMQALPRLQTPEKRNSLLEHVQAQRAAELMDARQPWPFGHREGFEQATAPRRGA